MVAKSRYMAFRSKFAAKSLRLTVGAQENISKENAYYFPNSVQIAKFAYVKH